MHRFVGYQIGKAFVVDKCQVLAELEKITAGPQFAWKEKRKARVEEILEETRRELTARRVKITLPDDRQRGIEGLPPGIHLQPGELRIKFRSTEDLLRHLFELSQAIANDLKGLSLLVSSRQV